MLLARPVLLAIGVGAAALACRPQVDRISRASQRARPHIESYRSFERWAQRAIAAPNAPLGADALAEIVFAPVRNASDVAGAWVELAGDRALLLALPASAPPPRAPNWVTLRDPAIGSLRVADDERCPETRAAARPSRACVFVTRAGDRGAHALAVTMAFAMPRAIEPQ
jgi:hypothetical protein